MKFIIWRLFFLRHATGEDLKDHLCLAIKNSDLPMINLIMLGSDGPNVNKKVYRLMNEEDIAAQGFA